MSVTAKYISGLASARPAAGVKGRHYMATDTGDLSLDNGTSWDTVSGGGGGGTDDTPGGFIGASITKSTAQTDIATVTDTEVTFDGTAYDEGGVADTANNALVAPIAGKYLVTVTLSIDASGATSAHDTIIAKFKVNDAAPSPDAWSRSYMDTASYDYISVPLTAVLDLDANDSVTTTIYHGFSATGVDVRPTASGTSFSMTLISNTFTPSYTGARMHATATQNIGAAYTKLLFDTSDWDTDGFLDLTNERFTVPTGRAGKYLFTYNVYRSSGGTALGVILRVNGSDAQGTYGHSASGVVGAATLDLTEGDYVEVYGYGYGGTVTFGHATSAHVQTTLTGTLLQAANHSHAATPDTSWHEVGDTGEPAFTNSWVNYGGSWSTAAFRIDAEGYVHLKGLVKNGTASTSIFTLPSGYRPNEQLLVSNSMYNGTTVTGDRLHINPTGTIAPQGSGTAWVTLDGVVFYADGS